MAISTLSLPLDIPWRRLCVSDDMIDTRVCDRVFPFRWRSSVTVFSYEPPSEEQVYNDQIVAYLKVACTITGFQEDPEEAGIRDRRVDSYWNTPEVIEDFKAAMNEYYPCYGAILEVAAGPSGTAEEIAAVPYSQYPYFIDFEPKKREVYEIVSESGEMMSRTLNNLNLRKGTTTTESHEVLDMATWGVSGSVGAGAGPVAAQVGASYQQQSGTKDITQEERTNMSTSDMGREMRELYSHTTQLTQMYHQFTGYHLGTNRAVFFMLPRPHIKQSRYTFVNGPRVLEGVQEVFLVVMRPKAMSGFCVEAYLETAHRHTETFYERAHREETFSVVAQRVGGDDIRPVEVFRTWRPDEDWEIDTGREGGSYRLESNGFGDAEVSDVDRDHIAVVLRTTTVPRRAWERRDREGREPPIRPEPARVTVTVHIRERRGSVETGERLDLWLTGRGVCCCQTKPALKIPESVLWESPLEPVSMARELLGNLNHAEMAVLDANRMRDAIGNKLLHSRNHGDRHPPGVVRFSDTEFVARRIAKSIQTAGPLDDQRAAEISGIPPAVRRKIEGRDPQATRSSLLRIPLSEQIKRFGLTIEEAIKVRRALMGLEGEVVKPKPTERTAPDLRGLSLDNARRALQSAGLRAGDLTYQDNEQARGTVLSQYPEPAARVAPGPEVDLVLASGAIVQIPDVVGKPLSRALLMLREAGLESEPDVMFAPSSEEPRSHVLAVTPGMRTYVTPHAGVALQVSSGRS